MLVMPSTLGHRRSVLDLFTSNSNSQQSKRRDDDSEAVRPATSSLAPPEFTGNGRPHSEQGPSRLSHEVLRSDLPDSPKGKSETARAKRFSMLRFRNYSESHLAVRAREEAEASQVSSYDMPPMPGAFPETKPTTATVATPTFAGGSMAQPTIMTTAPTFEGEPEISQDKPRKAPFMRSLSKVKSRETQGRSSMDESRGRDKQGGGGSLRWRRAQGKSTGLEDLMRLSAANAKHNQEAPPAYGNNADTELAIPVPRFSESSRSDGSHGSSQGEQLYGQTTTTTHLVSTHTTFFKLPRRNKNRNSLFPLPIKLAPPEDSATGADRGPATPRASTSGVSLKSLQSPDHLQSLPPNNLQRRHTDAYSPPRNQLHRHHSQLASPHAAVAQSSLSFVEPGMYLGGDALRHSQSSSIGSPLHPPTRLGMRDRASTNSSWGRASMDTPPALTASTRNSTSTTGRSSLGGIFNLSRFRMNSDLDSPRHSSPGLRSKSNSFALSREALVVPEREEGDTPGKYLERLESAVSRSMIAGILSKSSDPFAQAVLRSYTRRFAFFGEPIDMSLRKFLLEAELPKETQQVDRVIQAFADRYHECNPGIFVAPDQAYIIAFSLMMLHTDAFNKNNKRKMTKEDYVKNTSGQQVDAEILGCFYDNICYTPFVHYEEEVDINGERVLPVHFKSKKSKLKGAIADTNGKKPTGPVDPYNLLIEQKLEMLRPPIKDEIQLEDPFHYLDGQKPLDLVYLQRAFTHTGTLQIISARSRPAAFESQMNNTQPQLPIDTQQGIVDLKVTKVGTLWRKSAKRKKTRSPWQEWGAILTGSQLYLFKNAHWAKGLMHQFMTHQRHGAPRMPVTFQPPLQDFKPDALIKTDDAVVLVDASYTKHKNAFAFVRTGGQEEVFLADSDSELHDWLGLINYAAACRAAGVRVRGMIGGNDDSRDVHRLDSTKSVRSVQSPDGEVVINNRVLSSALTKQVVAARRQIMLQKIRESEKEIAKITKQLDELVRNARHLLILAPISPKTRELVMIAASRADASLKWLRRDCWRVKCHKDVLALDVQQDGVSASELLSLKDKEDQKSEQVADTPETAKKDKELPRLASITSARSSAGTPSAPQSPTKSVSPTSIKAHTAALPTFMTRANTTESMDNFVDDVFRTPMASTKTSPTVKSGPDWHLPPLQMDVSKQSKDKHRGSVASTLLTAASNTSNRQPSWSASSATSSQRPLSGIPSSPHASEAMSLTTPLAEPGDPIRRLAATASSSQTPNHHATSSTSKHRSARRSLQKTLRDVQQGPTSRGHHRKNKESESTVRSNPDAMDEDANETPGLERAKGRFILHGKQASVIQFGEDWPNERMRARREKWQARSPREESSSFNFGNAATREDRDPLVQDLDGGMGEDNGTDEGTYSIGRSASTVDSELLPDAEAAREYATRGSVGSESLVISEDGSVLREDESIGLEDKKKRQTVIGPGVPALSVQPDSDEDEDEVFHLAKSEVGGTSTGRADRRTIIGPSPVVN
nr:hypothetical protein B0A51_02202 [Rachicladosporium sp. CCFEE 5018]